MFTLAKLFTAIWTLGYPWVVIAGRRNITIDDQFGDERTHIVPTFMPVDDWIIGGTGGSAAPNKFLAYNGTWHDSTHWVGDPTTTVNFGFTGVCLYVYCIITNPAHGSNLSALADYKFLIDGELVGRYTHVPEEGEANFFNTSVYDNTTMENKFHNFSIVVDSTEQPVLLLFDYAVYTIVEENVVNTMTPSLDQLTPSPDAADGPQTPSGVVVGSTLGVVSLLFCVGLLFFTVRQRRRTLGVCRWRWLRHITFRNEEAIITQNPLLVLNPNTPTPAHGLRPREVRSRDHEDAIRDLRRTIQDLRAEKRAMKTTLGIASS